MLVRARRAAGVPGMAVLIILLVALLFGTVPSWPYSRNWGYGPSGIVALVLMLVLILRLLGKI